MNNPTSVQELPTLLHQAPGVRRQGVGRQQDGEQFPPLIHANSRPQRQLSNRDEESSLPDEHDRQLGGEDTTLLLVELAEGSDGSVPTLNQGSNSESSDVDVDAEEVALPIDDNAVEGEEQDGAIEDGGEQPQEPPIREPPGSPLRETQAMPCVHEPVQRQLSGTLVEGPIAHSMEER